MEKLCKIFAPKASPGLLFNFGKKPKAAVASKNFFKK